MRSVSLHPQRSKERLLEISAKVTSKGQITIPKPVRQALGIGEGDRVVFRVVEGRAVIARTPHLLELAGAVDVPAAKRGAPWDRVLDEAHRARAERRR